MRHVLRKAANQRSEFLPLNPLATAMHPYDKEQTSSSMGICS